MPVGILEWWRQWSAKRDDERFIEDNPPVPVVLVAAQGSGGEMVFGANALEGPTVGGQAAINTNLAVISANVTEVRDNTSYWRTRPTFSLIASNASVNYHQPRYINCTLTATAGGEIVAADIVPALAGYQTCALIWGIWSDQTDAAIAMAIDTASGVDVGPAAWTWATTAGAVTDYSPGVYYRGSADLEALQGSCAAGQAGNTQIIEVLGVYWYET